MESYIQDYKIVASDMDITYRITPNAILLYFQDCFANYLSSKRLAAFDLTGEGLFWVISEFSLDFTGERPLWSDTITVTISIISVSAARVYVSYSVADSTGRGFACGNSCWVIVSRESRRPVPALPLLSRAGISLSGTGTARRTKDDCSSCTETYTYIMHRVNITDLDFNGHVCNRSYLAIATATAPVQFISTHDPVHVHIRFISEAFFGQDLRCTVTREPGKDNFVHMITGEDRTEICRIHSIWTPSPVRQDVAAAIRRAPQQTENQR